MAQKMTVKKLRELIKKYDENIPVKVTYYHEKSKVIPGAFEVYETDKLLVYDAVEMDGYVIIHAGDEA